MRLLVALLLFALTALTSVVAKPPQCPKPPQAPPVKSAGKVECINGTCGDDCKCFGGGYYCPGSCCKAPPKAPTPPPIQYRQQWIGGRLYWVPVGPQSQTQPYCPSPNR